MLQMYVCMRCTSQTWSDLIMISRRKDACLFHTDPSKNLFLLLTTIVYTPPPPPPTTPPNKNKKQNKQTGLLFLLKSTLKVTL